ncbi:MAG: serine/threonine-protein phosphatase [Clostridia bacterium]|nr:serine/threonine-protein phosphatase [Clostridia bacterium]
MNYIISALTDIGITKKTNQDSYLGQVYDTSVGKVAFGIMCDGMGGLTNGELASATVVAEFEKWVKNKLPVLLANNSLSDEIISAEWIQIATNCNETIKQYGRRIGSNLGTTLCAILLVGNRYYIINVGDSRAYLLNNTLNVLTKDQTVVAREVELGKLTLEQAAVDPRRSVLLQCIGASDVIYPDMFFGTVEPNSVFFLCTDGFRHEITPEEIYSYLNPNVITGTDVIQNNISCLIEACKQRDEHDNISVLLIKTIN